MRVSHNKRPEDEAGTLAAQIRETERRLWDRQFRAHIHTDALIEDLRREMASPTALLLASELGFILGELTKRPSKSEQAAAERDAEEGVRSEVTPLKEVLDLGSVLVGLLHAMPATWLMETFHPEEEARTPKTGAGVEAGQPKAGVEPSKSGSPSSVR